MPKLLHLFVFLAYNECMKNYRKLLIICLTLIAVACLTAAGIIIISGILADKHADETLNALRESAASVENIGTTENAATADGETAKTDAATEATVTNETAEMSKSMESADVTEPPAGETTHSAGAKSTEETDSGSALLQNPYRDSFLANEDMAGWLQIPGTVIDYPVMWTPQDENHYLYRDFDGSENKNGCLILDTDSSVNPLTTNLIIHGHNMRSGAMFGNLTDYEDENYYKEHKQITLYTEECQRNYEVIAVFRSQVFKKTDSVFKFYKFFQADTEEEFDDFYQNIKAMSLYDTGVTAQYGDHFITLSTCVYHVEQGRFVVVAKEIESGGSYLPIRE